MCFNGSFVYFLIRDISDLTEKKLMTETESTWGFRSTNSLIFSWEIMWGFCSQRMPTKTAAPLMANFSISLSSIVFQLLRMYLHGRVVIWFFKGKYVVNIYSIYAYLIHFIRFSQSAISMDNARKYVWTCLMTHYLHKNKEKSSYHYDFTLRSVVEPWNPLRVQRVWQIRGRPLQGYKRTQRIRNMRIKQPLEVVPLIIVYVSLLATYRK